MTITADPVVRVDTFQECLGGPGLMDQINSLQIASTSCRLRQVLPEYAKGNCPAATVVHELTNIGHNYLYGPAINKEARQLAIWLHAETRG